jgi:hypothetical protein
VVNAPAAAEDVVWFVAYPHVAAAAWAEFA